MAAPDVGAWLADRPGFYDLVIAGDGTYSAAIAVSQLQAVVLARLPEIDAVEGTLASAGV